MWNISRPARVRMVLGRLLIALAFIAMGAALAVVITHKGVVEHPPADVPVDGAVSTIKLYKMADPEEATALRESLLAGCEDGTVVVEFEDSTYVLAYSGDNYDREVGAIGRYVRELSRS